MISWSLDAQGEVFVRIEREGRSYTGRGADTDIIVAAAKAVLQAINRLSYTKRADSEVRAYP